MTVSSIKTGTVFANDKIDPATWTPRDYERAVVERRKMRRYVAMLSSLASVIERQAARATVRPWLFDDAHAAVVKARHITQEGWEWLDNGIRAYQDEEVERVREDLARLR